MAIMLPVFASRLASSCLPHPPCWTLRRLTCAPLAVDCVQAKAAVSAAERDRKQLEAQLQAVSQGIEAATAALQDLQRQIKAAEVGGCAPPEALVWEHQPPCSRRDAGEPILHVDTGCRRCPHQQLTQCCRSCASVQAELATDMHAGLTAAERQQLAELQPQIDALEKELSKAKKAAVQVR